MAGTAYEGNGAHVMPAELPRLYTDLASWFHLLSAPVEYAEEATFYLGVFHEASSRPPRTLLELGSGGGCMASHYKRHVLATLVDLSPAMLALSRSLNPECEHLQGDMRSVRLGRQFDAVFVHDAISYLTTLDEVRRTVLTVREHCRPGGVAVLAPDYVRENFLESTRCGGQDGAGRSLRYLEWTRDSDPVDGTYETDFVYALREDGAPLRIEHETHRQGLFSREDWLRLLRQAGFRAEVRPLVHSEVLPGAAELFVAVLTEI
jgi:SAM-dependent methyltransferase